MRGYRFLISVSYPYPLKTIRIRIRESNQFHYVRLTNSLKFERQFCIYLFLFNLLQNC